MLDSLHFTGTWRDYQARVLAEAEEHLDDERLHVVAAPGAGKTVLGLELVRRIGRPALVFAPTIAIREQWLARLSPLFRATPPSENSVSRDLGDPRALTLATYQSLDAVRRADALDTLFASLNARGPLTLVLDEAHHLRREWWRCLIALTEQLDDVRIVALTATPPYDASFAEWQRYEGLCGPIDVEIGIPELVRNGDLCPHQDHVILSEPTAEALDLLARRREAIGALRAQVLADEALLKWFAAHPWLTDPTAHIEDVLAAPEMLSAVLVLLHAAGRELPQGPLELLGTRQRETPEFTLFWLERLLDGLLFRQRDVFPLDHERRKALEAGLHRHGLIEGERVRLQHSRSIFRLMASSLAKLESITDIARAEQAALGDDLRMVVLSDHIRAGEMPRSPDAVFKPAKLGVVPIFESLRRAGFVSDHLAVLTGSLVILPRATLASLGAVCRALGLDPARFSHGELGPCPGHITLAAKDGAERVALVTALFERGAIRVLVGTQSLLGEGWDAPSLNSLVLASNTASFMLSNQMRGRAIRTDPPRPGKVANIWHLATLDPADDGALERLRTRFDWGFLSDGNGDLSDIGLVARRFAAFAGIANDGSPQIESGLARLGLDPATPVAENNRRTFALAEARDLTEMRWRESLGRGDVHSQVHETASPNYSPRRLSWHDTLRALAWSAAGSGAMAGAGALRSVTSLEQIATLGLGLAGAATLATLPRLFRAARLAWRNGSVEQSLGALAGIVLASLHQAGLIGDRDFTAARCEVRSGMDGGKRIVISGTSRACERHAMLALAEILGPVENPRYLLVRRSSLGWKSREDYHAVPTALGTRKRHAEHFVRLWQQRIGKSELVYTRSPEGRRVLLRARARSFAAGFQRRVERRSVWL